MLKSQTQKKTNRQTGSVFDHESHEFARMGLEMIQTELEKIRDQNSRGKAAILIMTKDSLKAGLQTMKTETNGM